MADPYNPAPGSDLGPATPANHQDRYTMDTMELRLSALAARGFSVNVSCRQAASYDELKGIIFTADLSKGQRYGGGGSMSATGTGHTLDSAVSAALAAAEAFLDHPGPPAAVKAAIVDMTKALLLGAAE